MKRIFLILAFLLALVPPALAATNYYVDPSSNFTISGSSGTATPFEWLTQATSGAQAIFNFVNGSTVTVSGIIGTPNSSSTWTGAYSSATFTPSSAPSANGSDSHTSTQAQSMSTPWATGVHACGVVTGSQAGNAILIRAQTVCYNDQFSLNINGSAGNNFTLGSYIANTGDGALNPRVYASLCIPSGSALGLWTKVSGFTNLYSASLSNTFNNNGQGVVWIDDWYHAMPYPGSNGVGVSSYASSYKGTFLEMGIANPARASWSYDSAGWTTTNGLNYAATWSSLSVSTGGSNYPPSTTITVQVITGTGLFAQSSGQLDVTTNSSGVVTGIVGVHQDASTGGYVTGCGYATNTSYATYYYNASYPSAGGFMVPNLSSGYLASPRTIDFEAMVDTYPNTWCWDNTNKIAYIHNPSGYSNIATTAGYSFWVIQYSWAIALNNSTYVTVNGIDGYYADVNLGFDNNTQTACPNYCTAKNCNCAFAWIDIDIMGSFNTLTNVNMSYYGYAGFCSFDTGSSNPGYQTDQITINNCSDWFPVYGSYLGAVDGGGLFFDFGRNTAFGITWTNTSYNTFTSSSANITEAKNTGAGSESAYTNGISQISGNVYTVLMNLTFINSDGTNQPVISGTNSNLSGQTLTAGWNTVTWTASNSSNTVLTITTTGTTDFSLTVLARHQVFVNGYSTNNPNGSATMPVAQDYQCGYILSSSTNSILNNLQHSGQAEYYVLDDKGNLNLTVNGLKMANTVNALNYVYLSQYSTGTTISGFDNSAGPFNYEAGTSAYQTVIACYQTTNPTIKNSNIWSTGIDYQRGSVWFLQCPGTSTIEGCYINGGNQSGLWNIVRAQGNPTNSTFKCLNNVFDECGVGPGIDTLSSTQAAVWKNNLMINPPSGAIFFATFSGSYSYFTLDGNCWVTPAGTPYWMSLNDFGNKYSLSAWYTLSGLDAHSFQLSSNPLNSALLLLPNQPSGAMANGGGNSNCLKGGVAGGFAGPDRNWQVNPNLGGWYQIGCCFANSGGGAVF